MDGAESAAETLIVTSIIERAAVEMNHALYQQYVLSELADNDWCKWCNATLTAYYLFQRRGNAPPASIIEDAQRFRESLEQIRWGRDSVPEQSPSFDHTPTVTNFRPEIHKTDNPVRVSKDESTGPEPEGNRKREYSDQPGNL
jgi:hypothetical protein